MSQIAIFIQRADVSLIILEFKWKIFVTKPHTPKNTVVTRQKSRVRICKTTVQIIQRSRKMRNFQTIPLSRGQTVRQKKSPIVTADEDKKIEKIKKRTQENKTQEFMIIR